MADRNIEGFLQGLLGQQLQQIDMQRQMRFAEQQRQKEIEDFQTRLQIQSAFAEQREERAEERQISREEREFEKGLFFENLKFQRSRLNQALKQKQEISKIASEISGSAKTLTTRGLMDFSELMGIDPTQDFEPQISAIAAEDPNRIEEMATVMDKVLADERIRVSEMGNTSEVLGKALKEGRIDPRIFIESMMTLDQKDANELNQIRGLFSAQTDEPLTPEIKGRRSLLTQTEKRAQALRTKEPVLMDRIRKQAFEELLIENPNLNQRKGEFVESLKDIPAGADFDFKNGKMFLFTETEDQMMQRMFKKIRPQLEKKTENIRQRELNRSNVSIQMQKQDLKVPRSPLPTDRMNRALELIESVDWKKQLEVNKRNVENALEGDFLNSFIQLFPFQNMDEESKQIIIQRIREFLEE